MYIITYSCIIGGPLYDKERNVLVGVVSGGVKCGEAPGVYARIADQVSTLCIEFILFVEEMQL